MKSTKNTIHNIKESDIVPININLQKNISCSIGQIQGNRIFMEDLYLVDKKDDISIFAVLDGHTGKFFVGKAYDFIPKITNIIQKTNSVEKIEQKIKKLFYNVDNILFNKFKSKKGGSTILVLYVIKNKCIFINLGDCKCITFNTALIYETSLHRPSEKTESDRILKTNIPITNNCGIIRINDSLSVSRTIGDFIFKTNSGVYDGLNSAVSCIPDLTFKKINDNKRFFILGTDGLWDHISNQGVIDIVNKYTCKNKIIKELIMTAIKNGSNDNITVIFVEYTKIA